MTWDASKAIQEALEKFAISGAMHARALGQATQRSGGRVAPQILSHVAAQPRAQLRPGLAAAARTPGALAPTQQQQGLQSMMHEVPWMGSDHGIAPQTAQGYQDRFHEVLQQHGKAHAQPGVAQQINDNLGGTPHQWWKAQQAKEVQGTPTQAGQQAWLQGQGLAPLGGLSTRVGGRKGMVPEAFEPTLTDASSEHLKQLATLYPGSNETQAGGAAGKRRNVTRAPKEASFGEIAKQVAPYAIGAGVPLAIAGGIFGNKPAIRSNIRNLMESKGTIQEKDNAAALPEPVVSTAAQVHQHLRDRGINPSSLRIAVDAPPGSGKTTLSRALAEQLGVKHYGLDWLPHNKLHSMMGGGHIDKMPRAPRAGEILEHFNILRAYDPEMFDMVFHIQKDPETIKKQILDRGRSAGVSTFMDYDKSLAVGRLAFDRLGGEMVDLGNGTMMKMRPQEGWGGDKIDADLQQQGIDPSGLSRHEKLLSLHAGKRQNGSGWTPYFKSPFSTGETAAIAGSVPLGIGAALAARKYFR